MGDQNRRANSDTKIDSASASQCFFGFFFFFFLVTIELARSNNDNLHMPCQNSPRSWVTPVVKVQEKVSLESASGHPGTSGWLGPGGPAEVA